MNSSNNNGISFGGYESPVVCVMTIASEGVLCASFEEWHEETLE
jgi:hypothetical protein